MDEFDSLVAMCVERHSIMPSMLHLTSHGVVLKHIHHAEMTAPAEPDPRRLSHGLMSAGLVCEKNGFLRLTEMGVAVMEHAHTLVKLHNMEG